MDIEQRIAAIEARNQKVERDKAWEVSFTRRASICLITYLIASVVFATILKNDNWALNALVPVIGYLLSTLALPFIRKGWENTRR